MDHRKEIEKILTEVATFRHNSNVFDDWIDYCEACLRRLPENFESVLKTQRPAEDPEDVKELFARLNKTYKPESFKGFAHALHILMDSAEVCHQDVVGDVYMSFANPRSSNGQYFTPFPVCQMMAAMTGDISGLLQERMKEAFEKARQEDEVAAIWLETAVLTGYALDADGDYFERNILPFILPHIEPITVSDPACGSGALLLAVAEMAPAWAVRWNIVQFYGQDIDRTCVQMAKINCMLYSMNGYAIRLMAASAGMSAEIAAALQKRAEQVKARPEKPKVEMPAISIASREMPQAGRQLSMF